MSSSSEPDAARSDASSPVINSDPLSGMSSYASSIPSPPLARDGRLGKNNRLLMKTINQQEFVDVD